MFCYHLRFISITLLPTSCVALNMAVYNTVSTIHTCVHGVFIDIEATTFCTIFKQNESIALNI